MADIERRKRNDLRMLLRYTDHALERWPRNTPLISCSLPLSDRRVNAHPYAKGLLPEGDALAALAARAEISVIDTVGLLDRYGRDIAGALVIGADAPDEGRFALEPYDETSLGEEVGGLDGNPLGIHDDSEFSLAGLQNKMLLVKLEDGWARPLHGRPSTHILKAEDRRFAGLASAEVDCLVLARALELTTVETSFHVFAGIPCLITERYDRVVDPEGSVGRVHQEDLCQAVGIDGASNRGRAKYQRRGGGGPGLREAAVLLDAYADDPIEELVRLVAAVSFTVGIGNADAHAKNLSFLHDTPTTIRLAPLYDTVPTMLWPGLTTESAMSINGRFALEQLTLDDIADEAASWPLDRETAAKTAAVTLETMRAVADRLSSDVLATKIVLRCDALLNGACVGG